MLDGGLVTSREIRELGQRVIGVAVMAATQKVRAMRWSDFGSGRLVWPKAETSLGDGKRLHRDQREAYEPLSGPPRWHLFGACRNGKV